MKRTLISKVKLGLFSALFFSSTGLKSQCIFPFTEDFATGSSGQNEIPVSNSFDFNCMTYSVNGTGGISLEDASWTGINGLQNFSGTMLVGDYQRSGNTTHGVSRFSMVSTVPGNHFKMTELDLAVPAAGAPTLFTITGYIDGQQMVQVEDVQVTRHLAATYGDGTINSLNAVYIGSTDDSGYGLHLTFIGEGWENVNEIVFSTTGNDLVLALDNIVLEPALTPVSTTQVSAVHCGSTIEYLNTEYIAVDPVPNAEAYEFRIKNGAYQATATDNLVTGHVRLIQFAGYQYGVTYQMDVRAKVGGVWGEFDAACSISTTAYPHSEIEASQCGTIPREISSYIYATAVNGATAYRFRVTEGANVQTIDRPVRTFNLTMLPSHAYNTTYSIDVAVEFEGVWSPYSTSCSIITAALGKTKVVSTQCAVTLPTVGTTINAYAIPGATGYRFRITQGANVQTIDRLTPDFKLTQLPSYDFNTTYSIDVAFEYEGSWQPYGDMICGVTTPAAPVTKIQASQCGTTLAAATTYFYATSVSEATAYRFRLNDGNNVQTVENPTRAIKFTMLSSHLANTTYAVDVAVMINGVWGAYGPACNLTTPAAAANVKLAQCGTTLTKLDKLIYATAVPLADAYRFRITNGAQVQTIDRATNSFYLTQLPSYAYGTAYSIESAVQYGGVWQPYGEACVVTTPAAGSVTTSLISASCGSTVSANTQYLEADKVTGAAQYEFLVENAELSYSQSVVNNAFRFTLSQMTGLSGSTTYTVKVRTKVNNAWSAYGAVCNITTPGSNAKSGRIASADLFAPAFEAVTFPNPFSNGFGVKVATQSEEMIQVTVYDMSGKELMFQHVAPAEIHTLNIGEGFAEGIYQVRVVQGNETQTLRVVKQ